jgi:hypothetical protein
MSRVPGEPEMTDIESALRALAPVPSRLDRDRLMFEAGRLARGRTGRERWLWPSVAATLALVVAGESVVLASRPAPRVVERLVVIGEPSKATPSDMETVIAVAPSPERSTPASAGGVAPNRFEDIWGDPSQAILPPRWETVADARRLQDRMLSLSFDRLAEPRRGRRSSGPANEPPSRPASVGELRRLELEKRLNPGDRS